MQGHSQPKPALVYEVKEDATLRSQWHPVILTASKQVSVLISSEVAQGFVHIKTDPPSQLSFNLTLFFAWGYSASVGVLVFRLMKLLRGCSRGASEAVSLNGSTNLCDPTAQGLCDVMASPAFCLYLDICWSNSLSSKRRKRGREKDTVCCSREISYLSGAFHFPNQSKQMYFPRSLSET